MYLLVLPPSYDYAQFFLNEDQDFSLRTKVDELTSQMVVEGNAENERFFSYLQLLERLRPQADRSARDDCR